MKFCIFVGGIEYIHIIEKKELKCFWKVELFDDKVAIPRWIPTVLAPPLRIAILQRVFFPDGRILPIFYKKCNLNIMLCFLFQCLQIHMFKL